MKRSVNRIKVALIVYALILLSSIIFEFSADVSGIIIACGFIGALCVCYFAFDNANEKEKNFIKNFLNNF